jgi:hypothetical protein
MVTSVFLLRCKAEPRRQTDAFANELSPSEVLVESFLARPTARVPRGSVWHIGNTSRLAGGAVFFALGREVIVKAHEFDNSLREFREIEQGVAIDLALYSYAQSSTGNAARRPLVLAQTRRSGFKPTGRWPLQSRSRTAKLASIVS